MNEGNKMSQNQIPNFKTNPLFKIKGGKLLNGFIEEVMNDE